MAFPIEQVFEGEELQGPAWLMFFTETVRVIPPSGGQGGDGSAHIAKNTYLQNKELDLEEDDLLDLVTLLLMSGEIE